MSRIGRKPIPIPSGVEVKVADGTVSVKGPKGQVSHKLPPRIGVAIEDGQVKVSRNSDEQQDRGFHGLARALIANAVEGVSNSFSKALEIQGIGYRAEHQGEKVVFQLGYSHPVEYMIPKGVEIEVDKQTRVVIRGADKQMVGQVAADIRKLRKRGIYKGKGIRYEGERVKLKAGKTGA
jgi:large subunit ribosomal protein L6